MEASNMPITHDHWAGCVVGVVVALLIAVMSCGVAWNIGRYEGRRELQLQAVERGVAEYDAKTAEWKWKD